jgi:nicotinate-nucleotide--dimethylbenzimidazole phosphoribosyltransferase
VSLWERPIPLIGDTSTAADRAVDPAGWAFGSAQRDALDAIIGARRDVRRFRPDDVDARTVERLLDAAHHAPSVGHSQPWRFIVIRNEAIRAQAAWMADRQRLTQAASMDEDARRQLLGLQLEGIREAPVGIVVCCDRRADPAGVLGRATFQDADMWSCACAIQNLWLAARAAGLGVGWVTLFEPTELTDLLAIPNGVETLGWLCVGYPDERHPMPGLERHGWSARQALSELVMADRWNDTCAPPPPRSRVAAPEPARVVAARDHADRLLTPPGSLGRLDAALDRVIACCGADTSTGTLVLAAGDHPVADLGVTVYRRSVTAQVLAAAVAGDSIGVTAARTAGIGWTIVDAGSATGNLLTTDAMTRERAERLIQEGAALGERLASQGLVVLGEVGVGNTTVAAALTSALLGLTADEVVGLGSGADTPTVNRKRVIVRDAVGRWRTSCDPGDAIAVLATLGGPEFAVLCGVVLGVSQLGGVVVLDGLATGAAAAVACRLEPAVSAHLIAGQTSNEAVHAQVLRHLGLEPLLDLRLRAGEGVGGVMATRLILDGLEVRRRTARTRQ